MGNQNYLKKKKKYMELEFHAGFFQQLTFRQIEFFIETQFSKNEFQNMSIFLNSFRHETFS